ncbi:MAG TPA: phosphotransferase [Candidatus Hydrogenedentes bacterium]|nr:phosphotransferase [Candidatus Hydrogenedentota bacterium]HPG65592.1 phosphotransferase [Candidatus Hydrogenedentota bacterium]
MVETPDIMEVVARLVGEDVREAVALSQGRNNRVYCVTMASGRRVAVKSYLARISDTRDRLGIEYGALELLHGNGIRQVPAPMACDRDRNLAVYEFVEGGPCVSSNVTDGDIDAASAFLMALHEIGNTSGTHWSAMASEACISFGDSIRGIRVRKRELERVEGDGELYEALRAFLVERLSPLLDRVVAWSGERLATAGVGLDEPLDTGRRVLSPSDFGFHNAIRRPGGGLVFVDFEYFGWDDAAKMVADFVLHPGMTMTDAQKRRFVSSMREGLPASARLETRLPVAYALFGIKWCLILLNEFDPERLARRRFAGGAPDLATAQARQLEKAARMLDHVAEAHRDFPYDG